MQKKNKCKDCGKCCQYGSGFLGPGDKEKIAKHLKISVEELETKYLEKTNYGKEAWRPKFPKPFGPCIFFSKEKHCTIHEVKPLLCKLANCWEDATKEFYKKHIQNEKFKEIYEISKEVKKWEKQ